ncbi:hypothetical protein ABEW05_005085 [Botrytis cinerea]
MRKLCWPIVAGPVSNDGMSSTALPVCLRTNPISFSKSEIKNKSISASSKTFHAALADAILDGFVVLPASGYGDLKNVFKALTKAVETRSQVSDDIKQCIILQRYEYSPVTGRMSSFIRVSLFEVTSEMVEVQSSSTTVNVHIEPREHEAEVRNQFMIIHGCKQ